MQAALLLVAAAVALEALGNPFLMLNLAVMAVLEPHLQLPEHQRITQAVAVVGNIMERQQELQVLAVVAMVDLTRVLLALALQIPEAAAAAALIAVGVLMEALVVLAL